jgi:NTE family protein
MTPNSDIPANNPTAPNIEGQASSTSPVREATPDAAKGPEPGIALCLSGGGYRAMLFHLGSIWRLHELGVLSKVQRVSSVSGGSITAGVLALNWNKLMAANSATAFQELVVNPIMQLASHTVDAVAILSGALWFGSIADKVVNAYKDHLFADATLQDLPDTPRFVINATNVQTGSLWRFSKPYMGDWQVGLINNPTTLLATAVAASSAFPPVLSPLELDLEDAEYVDQNPPYNVPPYTTKVVLTDGGVYDNLGLETAWKRYDTILVSDGGGKMEAQPEPKHDWVRHSVRILDLIDNQVRSLRKRQVIDSFKSHARKGTYWGIRTDIQNYGLSSALPCDPTKTMLLANTATRLKELDDVLQKQLVNWGYGVCDAAMRAHVDQTPPAPAPAGFPFPEAGVG